MPCFLFRFFSLPFFYSPFSLTENYDLAAQERDPTDHLAAGTRIADPIYSSAHEHADPLYDNTTLRTKKFDPTYQLAAESDDATYDLGKRV